MFMLLIFFFFVFFFFNDTATTEIYTLSLHDALPISPRPGVGSSTIPTRMSPSFSIIAAFKGSGAPRRGSRRASHRSSSALRLRTLYSLKPRYVRVGQRGEEVPRKMSGPSFTLGDFSLPGCHLNETR